MSTYQETIPDIIEAGNSVSFALRAYDNVGNELTDSDGYTMYAIFNNGTSIYSAETTTYGAQGFVVALASADSSGWTAGGYNCSVYVDDATNRYPVTQKYVEVKPNLFGGSAVDSRSTARQTLAALDAAILGSATSNQMSMSIAGRSIQRMGLEELIKARRQFESFVADEDKAQRIIDGKPTYNYMNTRFR